jgi:hypothetical protein
MTTENSKKTDDPILCSQPGCPLKKTGIETKNVARTFLLAIADGYYNNSGNDSKRIKIREQCIHCAQGVLDGRKTYPTRDEWLRLVALGNWHQRRRSRRLRRYH